MRDGPTFTTCCGALAALLVLAGCQSIEQLGSRPDLSDEEKTSIKRSNNATICNFALSVPEVKWHEGSRTHWVDEAHQRGLTEQQCARLTGWAKETQIAAVAADNANGSNRVAPVQSSGFSHFSDTSICGHGLVPASPGSQPTWDSRPVFRTAVSEAKRRGFTDKQCAQLLDRENQKKFPTTTIPTRHHLIQAMSHSRLCTYALKSERIEWDSVTPFHVREAKWRGLTEPQCARFSGRFTETQIALASPPPPKLIKSTQRLLIGLGHLSGPADGIIGRKTTAAVESFQKSQNERQTGEINGNLIASLRQADRERITTAKADVSKTLAQLRQEQKTEEERLAKLKAQTAITRKELADASKAHKPNSAIPTNINFGNYHALVIGLNNYLNLPKLRTAVTDARAIGETLRAQYGFKVTILINPTRDQMLDKLDGLRASLRFSDNLLIYYAGHGHLDSADGEGYWLPTDAQQNLRSRWVSNATITDALRAIKAKHVMVMADSCYSGRLVRGAGELSRGIELAAVSNATSSYLKKMARKKARVVMTSGSLEPVEDGRGKHSPFARAILNALNENQGVIDGVKLFNTIRRPVMVNANQTPQYSDVRRAGHDAGDFLFVRRKQ